MAKSRDLDDVIHQVIKAGQIGRPVFVRCLIGTPQDHSDLEKLFLDLAMTVQAWVGDTIERVYTLGDWGPTLSVHLLFRNGASALISGKVTGKWIADLIILGNRGAIYRDAFWGGFAVLNRSFPDSDAKRALRAALDKAVESGTPQVMRVIGNR
jgi:hypothetical protein